MEKEEKKKFSLTSGRPFKVILIFMGPLVLANVCQQLYTMIDSFVVGNVLGTNALVSIDSTVYLVNIIIFFASGFTLGISVLSAQYFGKKDMALVKKTIGQAIVLIAAVGGVLTIFAVTMAKPLLVLLNTQPDVIDDAYNYIVIMFACLLITTFSNYFINTLRALGDSGFPMLILITGVLLNMGLDYLFVSTFGIIGVAIATVLCQFLTMCATASYLFIRYKELRITAKDIFHIDFKIIGRELYFGIPMALLSVLIQLGLLFVQTALNTLSKEAVAAFGAARKIENISSGIMNAMGGAIAVYTGQNYGAKNFERIEHGLKDCILIAFIISILMMVFAFTLATPIAKAFINEELAGDIDYNLIYSYVNTYIIINTAFYFILAILCIFRGVIQGVGKAVLIVSAAAIELISRAVISLFAKSFVEICFTTCITWSVTAIFCFVVYMLIRKKLKNQLNEDVKPSILAMA